MAKQNFLSGGYYGKLGMTVGQRWKNIRTIRSYVIPHNPRTPAQQANRGLFGDCVFYAQVGMQLNFKAPCFETVDKTAWNYRMSTARSLQDLGLTELERFPLYPINFSVPYQITAANVTEVVDETHIKVTVEGDLPEEERVLTMLLLLPGSSDWKERLAVCVGQNSSEDYYSFDFQLPEELVLDEGMQCRFISCDDEDSTTDLIASSQIDLEYIPIDEHTFDTTFVSLTRSGNTFTLTLAEPYQNGDNTVTISDLMAVTNGVKGTVTPPTATLINNGGNFAVVFTCPNTDNQDLWAFPSGCAIRFSEISSISSTVHATATSTALAISNDDLTRTYDNRFSGVTREDSTFTFTYARTAPTSTSGSGSIAIRAVSNGDWVNYTVPTYSATKTQVSFTQSTSNTAEIYAFPSGATVTENLTRIGNGVTYNAQYTTAQSITSDDLTRTYDNTISSVSRSDKTFTFALASTAPTATSTSGSLAIRAVSNGVWTNYTVPSYSATTASISFTQSTSNTAEIYAFPSGATVTTNITRTSNGVTYSPQTTTAQSITSDDLTRTYDNTISSVTRSSKTFTFAYATTAPTATSTSGSLAIRAVSNGVWTNYTVPSYSATTASISFTQSTSLSEEIYAFPSGATVTENITRTAYGVTYSPQTTTAQSVANTSDLSRTVTTAPSWSATDTAFIISLASGASITSCSGSASITASNHNQIFKKSASATLTYGYSGNKIKISSPFYTADTILLSDDSFAIPTAFNAVALGVTYSVPSQTVSVTKSGTQTISTSDYDFVNSCMNTRLIMQIENSGSGYDFTSAPASLTMHYPTSQDFSDWDGNIETVTLGNSSADANSGGYVRILISANLASAGLDISEGVDTIIEDDEWYLSDTDGNIWLIPNDDYHFNYD